jgi:hypothetical protein
VHRDQQPPSKPRGFSTPSVIRRFEQVDLPGTSFPDRDPRKPAQLEESGDEFAKRVMGTGSPRGERLAANADREVASKRVEQTLEKRGNAAPTMPGATVVIEVGEQAITYGPPDQSPYVTKGSCLAEMPRMKPPRTIVQTLATGRRRVRHTVYLPVDTAERLRGYCSVEAREISQTLTSAVEQYLLNIYAKPSSR